MEGQDKNKNTKGRTWPPLLSSVGRSEQQETIQDHFKTTYSDRAISHATRSLTEESFKGGGTWDLGSGFPPVTMTQSFNDL